MLSIRYLTNRALMMPHGHRALSTLLQVLEGFGADPRLIRHRLTGPDALQHSARAKHRVRFGKMGTETNEGRT